MSVLAYAYDGSPAAEHALERTSDLVAGQEAVVICAWSPDPEISPAADKSGVPYSYGERVAIAATMARPQLEQAARQTAEAAAERLRSRAARVTVATPSAYGDSAKAIAAEASNRNADTVIVGSRARSRLSRLLDGGTTSALLKCSPVPVLVVQQADESD